MLVPCGMFKKVFPNNNSCSSKSYCSSVSTISALGLSKRTLFFHNHKSVFLGENEIAVHSWKVICANLFAASSFSTKGKFHP